MNGKNTLLFLIGLSSINHCFGQCPTIVPTVNDTCVIGTQTIPLKATGSTGNYAWYDSSTGGSFLGNGSPFTTELLSADKSYFVAAQADNYGVDFDGIDDYVAIENYQYNSTGLTEVTVETWVNSTNSGQVIASFDRTEYWRLGIGSTGAANGRVNWNVSTNAGVLDFGGTIIINDGQWHHVAAVYDNGLASIYVDGILDVSITLGTTFGSGTTRFGFLGVGSEANIYNGNKSPEARFHGELDGFRVWSVAKTQAEIEADKFSCLLGTESDLDIYYDMQDGPGSSVVTDGVASNNGNFFNMSAASDWVLSDRGSTCPSCESARSQLDVTLVVPAFGITGGAPISCTGSAPILNAGLGFDSYLWQDGSALQTLNVPISGEYSVRVTLGATCIGYDTIDVSLNGNAAQSDVKLDGVNDYGAIDHFSYQTNGLTNLSVESWIKTTDAGNQIIISYDRSEYWRLGINGNGGGAGQVSWNLNTNQGFLDLGSTKRVDDGNWHHVAGTFDNGVARIYIDGTLDATATKGVKVGSGNSRFGILGCGSEAATYNGPRGPLSYFEGEIDEVRVWRKTLTEIEIRASMCQSFSGSEASLDMYLTFNESSGPTSFSKSSGAQVNLKNVNLATVWTTSAAPVGDNSVYVYPSNWSGESLTLTSCGGDEITVSNISGGIEGMHLYVVEGDPNFQDGMAELIDDNHYYGVFQLDGGTATYELTYKYANHPLMTSINEASLTLLDRADNTVITWQNASGTIDLATQEITLNSSQSREFIIDTKNFIWTGTVDTDWNVSGNWISDMVPPTGANIIIPDVINQPILDQDREISDLTIESNATVSLNGLILAIRGDLLHDGTLISDGIHPNNAGERVMAEKWIEALDPFFDGEDDGTP